MQNTQGTMDHNSQPKISQSDKLLFCIFLALAFHGMLFFGVGFKVPNAKENQYGKTFNVVLAQFDAINKPEKADFIGQADQEGGGESEQLLTPTAREEAIFNDPDRLASEAGSRQNRLMQSKKNAEVIIGQGKLITQLKSNEEVIEQKNLPDAAELIDKSYQLSGLIANIDEQDQNQARKGRKRVVSASIHRDSDALYLDNWRRKIERVGNLNYPIKAKINNIYGNVTMKVAINPNGTINNVAIMQSSGNKILDRAALSIVRMAAPFSPLTNEMTKDTDILEIIRVWQFQPDNSLKTR